MLSVASKSSLVNVVMLNVVMQNVVMLNVMLNVVMLNVVMLRDVASLKGLRTGPAPPTTIRLGLLGGQ